MNNEQFEKMFSALFENEEFKIFFQDKVKDSIKDMFSSDEIKIASSYEDKWEERYLVTSVTIDEEVVHSHKEYIGSSGWNDY